MTTQGDEHRARILAAIQAHADEYGYAPTYGWIARNVGINYSTVQWHLARLEQEQRIVRERGRMRSVEVVE